MNHISGTSLLVAAIGIAVLLILAAVCVWLWPTGDYAQNTQEAPIAQRTGPSREADPQVTPLNSERPVDKTPIDGPAAAQKPAAAAPAATIAELEARFRSERGTAARMDIVTEIAGHNDAAAVSAIARLSKTERNPEVKESLIAALGDINPDAAPAERLAILAGAMRGQPRNVRSTALGLLGQSDAPAEIALIKKAAADDPDNEIRETARAILEAGETARNALRSEGER